MSSSGLTRLLDRMVEVGLIDRQSCAEDCASCMLF